MLPMEKSEVLERVVREARAAINRTLVQGQLEKSERRVLSRIFVRALEQALSRALARDNEDLGEEGMGETGFQLAFMGDPEAHTGLPKSEGEAVKDEPFLLSSPVAPDPMERIGPPPGTPRAHWNLWTRRY